MGLDVFLGHRAESLVAVLRTVHHQNVFHNFRSSRFSHPGVFSPVSRIGEFDFDSASEFAKLISSRAFRCAARAEKAGDRAPRLASDTAPLRGRSRPPAIPVC